MAFGETVRGFGGDKFLRPLPLNSMLWERCLGLALIL
jgi:hypothetical protein